MPELLNFKDDERSGCYAHIKMDNGDPCYISIAQTGILVKKSRLGLFGAKLYEEKNVYRAEWVAKALSEIYPEDLTPHEMKNTILKSITNAVLHCNTLVEVTRVLNKEYKKD
jgi:hypothetical protein